MSRIVIDLDNTIARPKTESYADCEPDQEVVQRMRTYREMGFEIVIFTARNMRTFNGNLGKINVHTLPPIQEWLERHSVPFDEIWVGKPWCGENGFYVDDRAIRPDEFVSMSPDEIKKILGGGISGNDEDPLADQFTLPSAIL